MRITLTVCVVAIFLLSSAVNSQTQDRDVVFSINGPRPLSDAAMQLESKLGTAISYEDVALVYAGDYARALDTAWGRKYAGQNAQFKAMNRVGLVGGSLEIHVEIDPASGKPVRPVSEILQGVIDQHKARGNPGQFQLLAIGDGFVIVPSAKRDENGNLVLVTLAPGCGSYSKEQERDMQAVRDAVSADPAKLNTPDTRGNTPLHFAVLNNYLPLMDWLKEHGVDPNAHGHTATRLFTSLSIPTARPAAP